MPYRKEYMREYRQRPYVKAKRRAYERKYFRFHPEEYEKHKGYCKEGTRRGVKERKVRAINLLGGKCSRCGYQKCLAALEFHHQGGKKEYLLTNLIRQRKPWDLIEKEVKKCILLCANCHRELTYKAYKN